MSERYTTRVRKKREETDRQTDRGKERKESKRDGESERECDPCETVSSSQQYQQSFSPATQKLEGENHKPRKTLPEVTT